MRKGITIDIGSIHSDNPDAILSPHTLDRAAKGAFTIPYIPLSINAPAIWKRLAPSPVR